MFPTCIFHVASNQENDSFAICEANGEPLWCGSFDSDVLSYSGKDVGDEVRVIGKAISLAYRAREAIDSKAIFLVVRSPAVWLDKFDSRSPSSHHHQRAIAESARVCGVIVMIDGRDGSENLAIEYAANSHEKNRRDIDYTKLARGVTLQVLDHREGDPA